MQDRSGTTSRNPIWVTGSNVQTWKIFQIHGDHRWPGSVLHRNLPSKQYWAGVIIQISWYWSFPGWHCIFYHEWSMQKRTNTIEAYFKLIRSLKPLPYKAFTLLNLFDHLIKPILLYGCEIWAPVYLKYKNPTRPLTKKASFTQDLRDQFPYITKYMDRNDPILNCVSGDPLKNYQHGSICRIGSLPMHSSWTN